MDGKNPVNVAGDFPEFGGKFKQKPLDGEFRLIVYDHKFNRFWPQNPSLITWARWTRIVGMVLFV